MLFGIVPGDKIVICSNNSVNWAVAVFGSIFAKAVPICIDSRISIVMPQKYSRQQMKQYLAILQPVVIFSDDYYISQDFLNLTEIVHSYLVVYNNIIFLLVAMLKTNLKIIMYTKNC